MWLKANAALKPLARNENVFIYIECSPGRNFVQSYCDKSGSSKCQFFKSYCKLSKTELGSILVVKEYGSKC